MRLLTTSRTDHPANVWPRAMECRGISPELCRCAHTCIIPHFSADPPGRHYLTCERQSSDCNGERTSDDGLTRAADSTRSAFRSRSLGRGVGKPMEQTLGRVAHHAVAELTVQHKGT